VRHPSRKIADRFHFLGLSELNLAALVLCAVSQGTHAEGEIGSQVFQPIQPNSVEGIWLRREDGENPKRAASGVLERQRGAGGKSALQRLRPPHRDIGVVVEVLVDLRLAGPARCAGGAVAALPIYPGDFRSLKVCRDVIAGPRHWPYRRGPVVVREPDPSARVAADLDRDAAHLVVECGLAGGMHHCLVGGAQRA
jgi:hypothetical protein